jgi:biotin operon repressor
MREPSNLQRLITLLRDRQWHSGDELANKVSWRFGHTVFEARQKGYVVEKRKIGHNRFEYRMPAV